MARLIPTTLSGKILIVLCLVLSGCTDERYDEISHAPLADYAKTHIGNTHLPIQPDSLKILAIGNSFTENSVALLPLLLREHSIKNITLGKICYGGASLQDHERFFRNKAQAYQFQVKLPEEEGWNPKLSDTSIEEAVRYCEWDIIVLQQASAASGLPKHYQPYLSRLIEHILSKSTNPNLTIVWHMTWPYTPKCSTKAFRPYEYKTAVMYEAIRSATETILEETGIRYCIPSGTSINRLREHPFYKDSTDFTSDGIHIDHPTGQYALACTWFQTIIQPIYGTELHENTAMPVSMEEQTLIHSIVRSAAADNH